MKILIVLHDFRGGGAEKVAIKLANQLSHTVEVSIAFTSSSGPFLQLVKPEVKKIDMSVSRVLFSIPKLAKVMKDNNFDLIISHLTHVNVSAIIASLLVNKINNLVIVEHSQMRNNFLKQKNLLMKFIYGSTSFFYKFPRKIVAVSEGVAKGVSNFTGVSMEKIQTIYNPIIDNNYNISELDPPTHSFFKLKNTHIFIYVGRLIHSKRVDVLIESFKIVSKSIDSRLIIIGEGELRDKLEIQVSRLNLSDYVSFTGFVSDVNSYLKYSDTLVLTSEWEGLPSVLIEALAAGIQCVSTDCPSGPREILKNGELGFLCEVNNLASISESMLNSVYRPKNLISTDLERFQIDVIATEYKNILNE